MTYISGSPNNPPYWQAAHNGLVRPTGTTDVTGTNKSDHINQFLGTHTNVPCYIGDPVAPTTPVTGGTNFTWVTNKATLDYTQPFVLPSGFTGTVFRVTLPLLAINNGAPVKVSLCTDNGGGTSPNVAAPLAQTLIPANWLANLGAQYGLSQGGPLAHPMFNTMALAGGATSSNWVGPSSTSGSSSSGFSSSTYSGNFFLMAGGQDSGGNPTTTTAVAQYLGGTTMGGAIAMPAIPSASYGGALAATSNTVVYMGGRTNSSALNTVYTASWSNLTGVIGSWSAQASLPSVMNYSVSAVNPVTNTVYIAGGVDTAGNVNSNVYYTTPSNGQISSWNSGPTVPVATWGGYMAVLGNFLIYAGGATSITGGGGGAGVTNVWIANLDPVTGNIIGTWQKGPTLPIGVVAQGGGQSSFVVTDSCIALMGGLVSSGGSGNTSFCQVLTAANGDFAPQWEMFRWTEAIVAPWAAFQTGNSGQWQLFRMAPNSGTIISATLSPVPRISVPLPDYNYSLVSGTTYHIVVQVGPGVDSSSYVQVGFANGVQNLSNALQRTRHFNNNDVDGAWSSVTVIGQNGNPLNTPVAIPIGLFSQGAQTYTAAGVPSKLVHTWEDYLLSPGNDFNRYSNLQHLASKATTWTKNYKNLVTGVAEGTMSNLTPLNRDPLFLAGTTYYTPIGGATFSVVSSPSPATGVSGLSGRILSTGTAQSKVQSEFLPVVTSWASEVGDANSSFNSFFYMVACKFYCTVANQQIDLSVDWYDSNGNYISTSNYTTFNIPANTWKDQVAFYNPVAGARFARIVPLVQSLASGQSLYINSIMMLFSPECVPTFAPITQMTYNTLAGGGSFPSGLVQIA